MQRKVKWKIFADNAGHLFNLVQFGTKTDVKKEKIVQNTT